MAFRPAVRGGGVFTPANRVVPGVKPAPVSKPLNPIAQRRTDQVQRMQQQLGLPKPAPAPAPAPTTPGGPAVNKLPPPIVPPTPPSGQAGRARLGDLSAPGPGSIGGIDPQTGLPAGVIISNMPVKRPAPGDLSAPGPGLGGEIDPQTGLPRGIIIGMPGEQYLGRPRPGDLSAPGPELTPPPPGIPELRLSDLPPPGVTQTHDLKNRFGGMTPGQALGGELTMPNMGGPGQAQPGSDFIMGPPLGSSMEQWRSDGSGGYQAYNPQLNMGGLNPTDLYNQYSSVIQPTQKALANIPPAQPTQPSMFSATQPTVGT